MKAVLYNYDIYPKVVLSDTENKITVQPLGAHSEFDKNKEYTVKIFKVDQSNPSVYPERSGRISLTVKPDERGCLVFSTALEGEGEHFINLYDAPDARQFCTLSVYSLAHDMKGRIEDILRGIGVYISVFTNSPNVTS